MMSVQEIKLSLRQTSAALDREIAGAMLAARMDLESGGVDIQRDGPLVDMAITLYCKWQYDYRGKGPQYEKSYTQLKSVLAMLPAEEAKRDG